MSFEMSLATGMLLAAPSRKRVAAPRESPAWKCRVSTQTGARIP